MEYGILNNALPGNLHHRTHQGLFYVFALLTVFAFGCLAMGTSARAAASEKHQPAIVTRCQYDLAQRLKVSVADIAVIEVRATTWPDAALGMPEQGVSYSTARTPGWRIVLESPKNRYFYTTSAHAFRFGGPLALWNASMLYTLPVPNEPNLNKDLYQCSLIGTNHVRCVSGVDAYYPQAKGMILFTRRTSRSGFDLFSVKADKGGKPQRLYGGFYIGAAALNEAQDTWAAFVRPGLGSGWKVVVARIGNTTDAIMLPFPDNVQQPQRIAWSGGRLMIQVNKEKRIVSFETTPTAAAPAWKALNNSRFPGALNYMLNKSESLEIEQSDAKDAPKVEVTRVWFTGDRNVVATINGLTLRGYDLLGTGYAFVWGEQNGQAAAFTVQIYTGEVTPGFHGTYQDTQLFKYPPITKP